MRTNRLQLRGLPCLAALIAILSAVPVLADSPPANITLVPNRVLLQSCAYQSGGTSRGFDGVGDLVIKLKTAGGSSDYTIPKVKFSGIVADASGQASSGSIALASAKLDDILGSSVDIVETDGAVNLRTAGGMRVVEFAMNGLVTVPFNDDQGIPYSAEYRDRRISLTIDSSGQAALTATDGKTPGNAVGPPAPGQAPKNGGVFFCAGIKVNPTIADISLTASETVAPKFQVACKSGYASMNIPHLLTIDDSELLLEFDNLKVDDTGDLTVYGMTMIDGSKCDIALSNPAGFILSVQKALVSIEHSKTTAFYLCANTVLPPAVTDDQGGRVSLPVAWVDMLKNPVIDLAHPIADPVTQARRKSTAVSMAGDTGKPRTTVGSGGSGSSGGGGVTMSNRNSVKSNYDMSVAIAAMGMTRVKFDGYTVDLSDVVIDLSSEGPSNFSTLTPTITGPRWQGVYARKATITLPVDIWKTADKKPVSVATTNCYIDSNGFNGEIDAPAATLKGVELHGFDPKLKNLHIVFGRSDILANDCSGTCAVPGFEGELNLTIKITDTDASARITDPASITNPKLGLNIFAMTGTLMPGPDDRYALWLNGAVGLNVPGYGSLKDASFGFHQLGIDTFGRFVTTNDGRLNLDVPADVDLDLFRCHLSSLVFCTVPGSDANKPKWYIDMNGELSLNSDFPVSSAVDYASLRVVEGKKDPNVPEIEYKDIKVVADILGVARVSSVLNELSDKQLGHCLYGDAELELLIAGASTLLRSDDPNAPKFQLMIGGHNVWAVAGEVKLPTEIPIGNTGLGLYKFKGGLARNMGSPTGEFSDVRQLQPRPDSGDWLFMGGCSVCVVDDRPLFHADGTLTIGLPDFSFDIAADGWFLTESEEKPGQVKVNVFLDPSTPSFLASAAIDFGIPEKWIVEVQGNAEVLLSKADTHVAVGWPYPENAASATVLGGVWNTSSGVYCSPGSYRVCNGTSWNYWVFRGNIGTDFGVNLKTAPYLTGSIWASGCVDFWIASLGASACLQGKLYDDYLWFSGTFTATVGMPWPVPDIDVSVNFTGTI